MVMVLLIIVVKDTDHNKLTQKNNDYDTHGKIG
jgi:hypothetical protein